MNGEKARPFNRRALAAMVMAVSGIGLPLTGLIVHLHQHGPMNLARHAWMTAHWSLGLVFTGFALWHVILNRRPLYNYVRGAARQASAFSREFFWAVALVGGIVFLAAAHAFIAH